MGKHPLDKRLCCVAEQVRPGSIPVDIGTDHALLPIELVSSGYCPRAIASDIRPGPAARARRAVEDCGLSDRIDVRLGGGLSVIQPQEADDIVIAGMGGETIVSILSDSPWVASPDYRLILQPMSRPEFLRRWLRVTGFVLEEEPAVRDAGRLYTVLRVRFSPEEKQPPAGSLRTPEGFTPEDYRGAVPMTDTGRAYLLRQQDRLLRRARGLRESQRGSGAEEARMLEAVAGRILV